ncbi:Rnase E [Mycobacterium phage Taptic]|uniref:Uncharacterized protein n=1 Tax=Mycobacterium phage Taptic TaxID=1920305 RepID=A0A1J0ME33_9CAUD|nr:Rnase E [Mycobacterium phage Taptic]APD19294.1 hypothetical protein SEA_TAPTIC_64 [Mycobacterium phage Taptic]AVO21374.1 hypothetical protein PBI_MEGABEAR_64 [Mycobacterium phage Megabear]BBC28588.1 hypothetical protein [Mycobacterium phage D12]BBC28678.1 hypothetical protein [Mycobacterium phage PR]
MARKRTTVETKERARKAVDLKIAGATWQQISEDLGMKTEAGARLLVARYFEDVAKTQFEEMHPILLERGEALWRKAWAKLNQVQRSGSMEDWDKAMRHCVSVLQNLARISGLGNGPTIEVNVTTPEDVRRLRDEFYELRGIGNAVDAEVVEVVEHNGTDQSGSQLGLTNGHSKRKSGLDD